MRDLNSHRIAVRTSTLDRADVQPTTHRIAKVMANIRHRPPVAVFELIGPGLATDPKNLNIFKNVKLYCQFVTPATMQTGESENIHQSPQLPTFFAHQWAGRIWGIACLPPKGL